MNPLEQHYEGRTPYIKVNGVTPFMNTLPFHYSSIANKKSKKALKNVTHPYDSAMNIAFEKSQGFKSGDEITWEDGNMTITCTVLLEQKAFIKGNYYWLSCVVIKEK